jgi:Zinc finger, C3HC4 type (RING finger)
MEPFENLVAECQCTICHYLYVRATSIFPCGHIYCWSCYSSLLDASQAGERVRCPICRVLIRGHARCVNMDNMVRIMVDHGGMVLQTDVDAYNERSAAAIVEEETRANRDAVRAAARAARVEADRIAAEVAEQARAAARVARARARAERQAAADAEEAAELEEYYRVPNVVIIQRNHQLRPAVANAIRQMAARPRRADALRRLSRQFNLTEQQITDNFEELTDDQSIDRSV